MINLTEKNSILLSTIPFSEVRDPETLIDYMLDKKKFILINDYDNMFMVYELNEIEEDFDEIYFSIMIKEHRSKRKK